MICCRRTYRVTGLIAFVSPPIDGTVAPCQNPKSILEAAAPLIAEAKNLGQEIRALLPQLAEARRNWFRSRSDADAQTLEAIEAQAGALSIRHKVVLEEMQRLSGIPEEVFEALENAQISRQR